MISYSWRYSLDFWNIFTTWLPNLTVNLGVGLWPATYQCYCFIQWLAGLLAQLRMELCWGLITPGDSVVPCRKEEDTKASDLFWKKMCSGLHGPRVEGGWGCETSLFLHGQVWLGRAPLQNITRLTRGWQPGLTVGPRLLPSWPDRAALPWVSEVCVSCSAGLVLHPGFRGIISMGQNLFKQQKRQHRSEPCGLTFWY